MYTDGHPLSRNGALPIWVLDAQPRPDRRAQGHDRDRARILELLRRDRIVDAIDHRQEALLREHLGRRERFAHVRIERLRLAEHLELDEVPAPRLRSEEHTSELQSLMRTSYAVFCL